MTGLADLAPLGEDLVAIVMGPGFGETVIVRWPPDHWLIVDSWRRPQGRTEFHPGVYVLETFGSRADAIALTHPHLDHASGFSSLIEYRKEAGRVGWWPRAVTGERWDTPHGSLAFRRASTEHAVAAIARVWQDEPDCRWELHADGPPLLIGGASVDVLTPLQDTVDYCAAQASPDYNEMSSAMVVSWEGCRILLGADLVNVRGWNGLAELHGDAAFALTQGMKVSHHGSEEAQHPVALGVPPPTERVHLGTPFNRKKVPDFRDGGDVDRLLAVALRVYFSAHHGPPPPSAGVSERPRARFQPSLVTAGPLEVELDVEPPKPEDCWVAARWGADGSLQAIDRGPGSICVVA